VGPAGVAVVVRALAWLASEAESMVPEAKVEITVLGLVATVLVLLEVAKHMSPTSRLRGIRSERTTPDSQPS